MSISGFNFQALIMSVIGAVIALVVGMSLGPTFVYYIGFINATSMENITMGPVLALIANYGPFFYYLGFALFGLTAGYAASKKL